MNETGFPPLGAQVIRDCGEKVGFRDEFYLGTVVKSGLKEFSVRYLGECYNNDSDYYGIITEKCQSFSNFLGYCNTIIDEGDLDSLEEPLDTFSNIDDEPDPALIEAYRNRLNYDKRIKSYFKEKLSKVDVRLIKTGAAVVFLYGNNPYEKPAFFNGFVSSTSKGDVCIKTEYEKLLVKKADVLFLGRLDLESGSYDIKYIVENSNRLFSSDRKTASS